MKLLIVEDDAEALRLSCRMIGYWSPQAMVYAAGTAEAGLALFKAHHPDILITDINLGGKTGLEMVKEIKSLKEDTKVIVITGYSDEGHVKDSMRLGVDDYIAKPLDFKKLVTALEVCWEEIVVEKRRGALPD